jgi:Protein of unknown function (DUF998)
MRSALIRTIETGSRTDTAIRTMLTAGVIAGPLLVATATVQILTRDGFDLRRHLISLLSVGEHGWIEVMNFILAGVLRMSVVAACSLEVPAAAGIRGSARSSASGS